MRCSNDHEAMKRCARVWASLDYVGMQPTYDDEGTVLELRNCSCGSTLARATLEHAAAPLELLAPGPAPHAPGSPARLSQREHEDDAGHEEQRIDHVA